MKKYLYYIIKALLYCAILNPIAAFSAPKIIGYITSWRGDATAANYPYSKVTHFNYAFALPNADGTLRTDTISTTWSSKLNALVEKAHRVNVKVSLSVGGWSDKDGSSIAPIFEALANSPTTRSTFINAIKGLITKYKLDGVDIDWEYPTETSTNNFLTLMQELYAAIHPLNKLVTSVGPQYWYDAPPNYSSLKNSVDWVNVESYNSNNYQNLPFSNPNSMTFPALYYNSIDSIEYWHRPATSKVWGYPGLGFPYSKIALGMSFSGGDLRYWYNYNDIVSWGRASLNPYQDTFSIVDSKGVWTVIQYSGPNTVKTRSEYVKRNGLAGIMFWEADQDAYNNVNFSLVKAMCSVIKVAGC